MDDSYFKMIDDFEGRFPYGAPSLVGCGELTVEGDITFGRDIVVEGETTLRSNEPHTISDGAILNGTIEF